MALFKIPTEKHITEKKEYTVLLFIRKKQNLKYEKLVWKLYEIRSMLFQVENSNRILIFDY